MKLTFLGATKTVTGSKYLIESGKKKYLIDCGLFQGYKELRLRNWEKFPIDPSSIEAIVLTHAHIDHSGYIPKIVKEGFKGKVYCTPATHDLCKILLMDSAHLQEEDARWANRKRFSKHKPALPLYTKEDAERALHHFSPVDFHHTHTIDKNLKFTFHHAGHILGASFVTLTDGDKTVLFSGDLGRLNDPVMNPPDDPTRTDYVLMESTYGNRLHEDVDPMDKVQEVITSTSSKGGSILIPAFAVGRAQSILYYIYELKHSKSIPDLPVYVDSPMATSATNIFCNYDQELRISKKHCDNVCEVATYVRDVKDSIKLNSLSYPSIIISASGMATGGRVLHHLKHFLPKHKNTVLLSGFQAGGTRGDRILRGEKEIKIHGKMYPVRARIETLENVSAHADYSEILTWLEKIPAAPDEVFITHGEEESAIALKEKIEEKFGWQTTVPEYLQSVTL